jgi:outer membrane protein OmpA-like peptidoglycan-associated protein
MEYVGDKHYLFYHKELPEATRALEAARSAGRDKECPTQFSAAEALVKEAYDLYYSCHTKEAITRANEAIAATNALCPRVAEAPRPAPAPAAPAPSAAPPTISLSAASGSIQEGSCTALTWTTTNRDQRLDRSGIGSVEASGSRQVCPTSTTRYTLTATGAGGTRSDSTTVDVSGKPAAPAAPIDRMTLHVNFDVDKSVIRKADRDELEKAAAFVRKYAGAQISIQGYTDSTGSEGVQPRALSEKAPPRP